MRVGVQWGDANGLAVALGGRRRVAGPSAEGAFAGAARAKRSRTWRIVSSVWMPPKGQRPSMKVGTPVT